MFRTNMMDEQDYNPKFKLSSEVLMNIFDSGNTPLSEQFIRWKLWAQWKEVVGPTIAQYTEPVGYQRGCLYLWVKNSTWMQQMIFMREPIQKSINSKLQKKYVRSIRFTLDRRDVPKIEDSDLTNYISKIAPPSDDDK